MQERILTMENNKLKKDIIVMCGEPSPGLTIEKANELFSKIETEKDIADLYAEVENKAWWIEDEQYDYDVGTDEYKVAREKTRMWFSLSDKLKEMIFVILKSEGIVIPDKGQIAVLEPFMKRNGYKNGSGWWIKE